MKPEQFSEALGAIDESYLQEAELYQKTKTKHFSRWVAAIVVLILSMTGLAVGAEAIQYQHAIVFFEENNLSTQGMTRREIIRIYQEFTSKRYEFDQTALILTKSLKNCVDGISITGDFYTSEKIADMRELFEKWDAIREKEGQPKTGISYDVYTSYYDEHSRYITYICKYRDGELQWKTALEQFKTLSNPFATGYGYVCVLEDVYSKPNRFALLDPNGNVLFIKTVAEEYADEEIYGKLITQDSLIIFTGFNRDDPKLGYYEYDFFGNLLNFKIHDIAISPYGDPVEVSDGYMLLSRQVNDLGECHATFLVKLDKRGNLVAVMQYESAEFKYDVQDMMEYEGKLYLSVTQSPVEKTIFERENGVFWQFSPPTEMMQEYYDATLLICNAKTGEVENFYTVNGALGSDLRINSNGQLEWNVETIAIILYSNGTSAYRLAGITNLYSILLDSSGTFINYVDTAHNAMFYR